MFMQFFDINFFRNNCKMSSDGKRTCLICSREYPKGILINHIAEHLNYKRHKCSECTFENVLMEAMVDHQNRTSHKVAFNVINRYLERVCQLVYSDFEYAQKHGEQRVLGFGAAFGDKQRLTEMLNAGDIKEEEDDIELIENLEEQAATQQTPTSSTRTPTSSTRPSQPNSTNTASATNKKISRGEHNQQNVAHQQLGSSNQILRSPIDIDLGISRHRFVQTAPADSSNERPKKSTPPSTEHLLAELQRQITKGEARRKCGMCNLMVDNDYKSQKEHVMEKHTKGMKGDANLDEASKLRWKLERCFKKDGHVMITNDLQCNICGHETKYKETRYHHVSAMHTDYQWECVFPSCDFVVRSKRHFNTHLNTFHELNLNQLEGEAQDRYFMMNSDFQHKLTPLVRKCFPFDLPNMNNSSSNKGEELVLAAERKKRKSRKKRNEDDEIDNKISNFMPTREYVVMNRALTDRPSTKIADEYESSDDSDSDKEEKAEVEVIKQPEKPKEKTGGINIKQSQAQQQQQKEQNTTGPKQIHQQQQQLPCSSSSSLPASPANFSARAHSNKPRGHWVGGSSQRGRPRGRGGMAMGGGTPHRFTASATTIKKPKIEEPVSYFRR